ncbi:MAG: YHYH protein [Rickettsiaceae bacterium]|nr:YHYH protein [Rickettsiaceae bacterium]
MKKYKLLKYSLVTLIMLFLQFLKPLYLLAGSGNTNKNYVNIHQDSSYLYIDANGIPNHETGQFPGKGNPHAISEQNYHFKVIKNPQFADQNTIISNNNVGVALNGIPFDPGTAECYGKRQGRGHGYCQWRYEAIVSGSKKLGLDNSNAHVQPNGAYHYHGIPTKLLPFLEQQGDIIHVGYAADGFRIFVSKSNSYKPSYVLKHGTRSIGGEYDGTFTQDFEYSAGSGNLDECNGIEISGEYAYFVTDRFPFVPRCLKGNPDKSFFHNSGDHHHKKSYQDGNEK